MLKQLADTRRLDATLQYTSMSSLLADFRRWLERDAGTPIERLEVNGALLLSDLCTFLKLGAAQREKVLGRSATIYVAEVLGEQISLPRIH